jgi:hypothetical protein
MIILHDSGRFLVAKGPSQSSSVQVSPSAGLIQFPSAIASILLCVFASWRLCVKGRRYGVQRQAPKTPRRGTKQDKSGQGCRSPGGGDFLICGGIQGWGRYVGGTSLTSFAYVVLSFCKSLISMIILHDSGRFLDFLLCVFAPWRLCVKGCRYGVQRKAPKTPRRGTRQKLFLCMGSADVLIRRLRRLAEGIRGRETPKHELFEAGFRKPVGGTPAGSDRDGRAPTENFRKLLNSMIIWDSSGCFLRRASPGRSCPVQVSQTIVEILGEGFDGSKSPKWTGRRCLKIGANRSKSGQIGLLNIMFVWLKATTIGT